MVCLSRIIFSSEVITSKGLYKYLMRECAKLPQGAKEYYKHHIRQSFKQHISESDPTRIKEIIERALEDGKWVVNKYTKSPPV